MSTYTKQSIADAFLRVLSHKPFRKITVRDIVEECGINRTTFYYHFQDIYAIVEELALAILSPYAAALVGKRDPERIRDVADFITMHKRALRRLWEGLSEESVRRYIFAVIDSPLASMVEAHAEGLCTTAEEREGIRLLLREGLFGYFYLRLNGEFPLSDAACAEATRGLVRTMLENLQKARGGKTTDACDE